VIVERLIPADGSVKADDLLVWNVRSPDFAGNPEVWPPVLIATPGGTAATPAGFDDSAVDVVPVDVDELEVEPSSAGVDVVGVDVFDVDELSVDDELDDDELVVEPDPGGPGAGAANATPEPDTTAAPMPNAAASPPSRPTCAALIRSPLAVEDVRSCALSRS
jgi:hypothetical protein